MYKIKEIRSGDVNKRAGIIIIDGRQVLGCLPTPSIKYPNFERKLDLPKGHMQEGETPIQSAIRECWEETNIKFEEWKLEYTGEFVYDNAPLFLFRARLDKIPELSKLNCPSTFQKGIVRSPENCNYELVPYEKISERFFPELCYAIQESINK